MIEFTGKWITDSEFCNLKPRNVFHRQLQPIDLPCDEHRNRHILFRKKFNLSKKLTDAKMYISADDYYKLYINGKFAGQGPAASYHFRYNYNVLDVSDFLVEGENTIAVHTLYQGLINRVWQSGDNRHGLLLELKSGDEVLVASDETFKTMPHSGYREIGIAGYDTQFLEEYNSCAAEVGFEAPDFDDSAWEFAKCSRYADYSIRKQESQMLVFENIMPVSQEKNGNCLQVDFGSNYVGYIRIKAEGKKGDTITIRCGQELCDDGSVRYDLRANCKYEETWVLSDGVSTLDQFDYKAFRYAQIILPEECEIKELYMEARHYPFELKTGIKKEYASDEKLKSIWELCVHSQQYGIQESVFDCMEREKGFYIGDGIWTTLTYMILTRDDTMMRKLIDDAFSTDFITDGLVTCLNGSLMQEIAESPLMLVSLVWWHYKLTGDKAYLAQNFPKALKVLESYRREYETDGLLNNLDKWCVVEWPPNFRDGYDAEVIEGKVCTVAHIAINAYYLGAIKMANKISMELTGKIYRDEKALTDAFINAFYNSEKHLFKDSAETDHISIVGNTFPIAFGLCPDEECAQNIMDMYCRRKISSVFLNCTFSALMGFIRYGNEGKIKELMLDEGAWLRMIREGATTTFEGWGKDSKWNTSLFHLAMSYGALFLADADLKVLFE